MFYYRIILAFNNLMRESFIPFLLANSSQLTQANIIRSPPSQQGVARGREQLPTTLLPRTPKHF